MILPGRCLTRLSQENRRIMWEGGSDVSAAEVHFVKIAELCKVDSMKQEKR